MPIDHLLTQTCDLYAPVESGNGTTYSETATTEDVKCRVEPHNRQITNAQGMTVTSDAMIFLPSSATVTRGYKIVSGGVSYIADIVNPMYGIVSLSHYECLCRML